MINLSSFTKSLLHQALGFIPLSVLRRINIDQLILPFYHAVSDEPLGHIDQLYNVKSTQQFRTDIDFLLKHYKPISVSDLMVHVRNGTTISNPSFLLSFDDGLSQVHDVIAPILKEKGVPAVCFLNSGFIDNQGLFFRYKVSLIIDHVIKNSHKLSLFPSHDSLDNFRRYMLSLSYEDTDKIDKITDLLGLDYKLFLQDSQPYLRSEQITSLVNQGWCFGGHSIDHPLYSSLPLDEQLRQTVDSVSFVKEKFNLDAGLFSFPFTDFGVKQNFFKGLELQESIDLTFGCAGMKQQEYPFHYQRIPMEDGLMSGEEILKREYLYYGIKAVLSKNKIVRHA